MHTIRPNYFALLLVTASLFLLNTLHSLAGDYEVTLRPKQLDWKPKRVFIQEVIDRRKEKNNGVAFSEGSSRVSPVRFNPELPKQIYDFFRHSVTNDTSLVPVTVFIDAMKFDDKGSAARHSLFLDFKITIVRRVDGKEYELYQTNAKPEIRAVGTPPNTCEDLLEKILEKLLVSFEDYVNTHNDQPTLCKRIIPELHYDKSFSNYENGDTIRWTNNYRLKWSDFQGKPSSSSPFSAQSQCIFTYSATFDYRNLDAYLLVNMYPTFARKYSWVRPDLKTPELLGHEQLHFDICELFIRQMRKKILTMHLSLVDPETEIRPVFDQAWIDYQKTQNAYDEETNHGTIDKEQQRWKEKISNELDEYVEFRTKNIAEE